MGGHSVNGGEKMKKMILLTLIVTLNFPIFGEYIKTPSHTVVAVPTAGVRTLVPAEGVVSIFAHGKIYYDLSGVTPNAWSPYLVAGQTLSTEQEYRKTQYIGLKADASATTINIVVQSNK